MDHPRKAQPIKASHIALSFLSSFLLSIFLLQWWQETAYPLWLWISLGTSNLVFGLGTLMDQNTVKKWSALSTAIVLGIIIALASVARTAHLQTSTSIESYATERSAIIRGIIVDAPDDRKTFINYTIETKTFETSSGNLISVSGKILATDRRRWPRFQYGDEVRVTGILSTPKPTETFAYDNYLSRFDIYALQRVTKIEKIRGNHGNPIIAKLITIREAFEAQINRLYPEPHAAFLAGLLTGSRSGMPDHLTQGFKKTGLTHIVAISGFNITIIIAILSGCLFFLPLRYRFIPTIIAIILFTLFVGASASVVRASIMGILGLLALQTGRMRDARLAILWTAFFMLVWNPKELWYDMGFQLSFLAVIGLTEAGPILQKYFQKIPTTLGLREALTMTVAAQVFAMPWVAYQFGTLSIISPLANILVAPFIPFAMLFGFLGTILSFVYFPLGQVIGYLGWGCLEIILILTQTLASIPYASVTYH